MIATLGFTAIHGFARRLPLGRGYALARAGARLHSLLAPGRRAILGANLAVAQGFQRPSTTTDLDSVIARGFENHARALFDWLRASAGHRMELEIPGVEALDRALAAGRGAILGTVHVGSWEAAAIELAARGYPLTVVTGEQLGRLAPAVRRHKAAQGIAVVRPADGMRDLYRHLARNRILILLLDGDIWRRGQPIPFLGRPTVFPWGAERLARSTGAPLLPAVMRRSEPGRLRAQIYPALDLAPDPAATMRALVEPLERAIAADPDLWCLFRRLWDPPAAEMAPPPPPAGRRA
jgi:lauroyl/myristoyl acyltransferase